MHPVSVRYIDSMAAPLREIPTWSLALFSRNGRIPISFPSDTPLQNGQALHKPRTPSDPRATFEECWMRADGRYALDETEDYIGGVLSAGQASVSGEYPYSSVASLTLGPDSGSGTVTVLCDAILARAQVTYTDSSGREPLFFAFSDDGQTHRLLFEIPAGETAVVTFLSAFAPMRRMRVYAVCRGTAEHFDAQAVLSAELTDDNDLMCLEIPGRAVTVEIANQSGWLDPLAESNLPRYVKNETNAYLTFHYNGETVPIGRLYLSSYTVTRKTVIFRFSWAAQPLNTTKRTVSCDIQATAWDRYEELTAEQPKYILPELISVGIRSGVGMDISYRATADVEFGYSPTVSMPLPAASDIECLQAVCNAAGWILRPDRSGDVLVQQLSSYRVRTIGYGELFSDPTYGDTGMNADATVEYAEIGPQKSVQPSESIYITTDQPSYVKLSEPAGLWLDYNTAILSDDGVEIGYVVFAAQGYALYAYPVLYDHAAEYSGMVALPACPTVRSVTWMSAKMGGDSKQTVRNPLIDAANVKQWWQMLSSRLSSHVTVSINHRGFPELDCGDVIGVQLTPGGAYQTGVVRENKWQCRSGVMSGSTTILLPGGVG